ncbi:TPA: TIGR03752 family integrating conjugative element protein [Pasteurella multocida]|uniref:TIGR03752 family integrating conjugative element protein n=1 Tax=Pasteurella multocida TaxID=747 RepID=UPI0010937786|nr:TIGR03752 family integrating conjugative element protein [Pasteurella multocida]QCA32156.1 TIGR03752 family integrating conjugative element protein [Pasteurella multocida]QXG51772.1 TIGR03752 family integrating conjugative element protein [Pasteurella multocida]WGE13657.1 TIGR03752 family integrating conjugative element protein [Pasteurella multocida]HDX0990424.1 TIGR03752 family integrating conjugative element protein [Pasteurella multocida]HDX1015691.1 TIGR03752 family integrating conjuga
MQANKALYVIVSIVVAMVGAMGWFLFSPSQTEIEQPKRDVLDISINDLTPEEIRAMGIQGDTPQDTLRTLVATAKNNQKKFDQTLNELDQYKRENERLTRKEADVNYQINEAIRNETQPLLAEIAELKRQLVESVENPTGNISGNGQDGVQKGFGAANNNLPIGNAGEVSLEPGTRWVEPSDQIGLDSSGKPVADGVKANSFGYPSQFKSEGQSNSQKKGLPFIDGTDETTGNTKTSRTKSAEIPYYTLPENSTLLGSISMTALIGRVPVGNNVTDPYPFKVVIGRENLIANGFELPDVEGAIVSGTASGDWTLSCVRGSVKSMTFVFSDGRIVTSSQAGGKDSEGIGWLSDESGIPCVPGERKTNAPEYLGSNFLLAGASAAAQGLSQAQTTTVVDGDSVVGAVTGDNGKYILGQALGGGLKETADWFRERYGQMFDAVYVPPGHPVAIHLEKEIAIDYSKLNRKVKYRVSQTMPRLD